MLAFCSMFENGHPTRELLRGTRNPGAVARFERHLRAMRREAIEASRALVEIEACAHYQFEGCSSIEQFGERHGASANEVRQLIALAKGLDTYRTLQRDFTSGRTSLQSAAALGRLAERAASCPQARYEPPFLPDEWAERALTVPARDLSRQVDEWLEARRLASKPVSKTVYLSAKGANDFERARAIASRKAKHALSEGETVERLADHYLDSFDLTRKTPRKRRLPDTSERPFDRYVAAEVRRAMLERRKRCAVPRCPNGIFLEASHRVAHAAGGSRELANLDTLCSDHHAMYEQGLLKIEGPTDAPVFHDANGNLITATSEWDFDVSDPEFEEPAPT
jgi:hypothetical protein